MGEETFWDVSLALGLDSLSDGRGFVAFDFDPNFRAFWWGTQGLFLNAVFFGGAF